MSDDALHDIAWKIARAATEAPTPTSEVGWHERTCSVSDAILKALTAERARGRKEGLDYLRALIRSDDYPPDDEAANTAPSVLVGKVKARILALADETETVLRARAEQADG